MLLKGLLVLLLSYVALCCGKATRDPRHEVRKFPEGLLFGAGSAAYQVEGAVDEDGRTESMWDLYFHSGDCMTTDCINGDIASDSYHNIERDVRMMRELGLQFYRFSISWNRLLPTSFPDHVNELGVNYYNNLIDEMLKYNITPLVTLYHWDLPETLNKMGGWTNPLSVDWFADYAQVAFELFGDRVKLWNTFNEPHVICHYGYGKGSLMPQVKLNGIADYICAKNVLLAHAKAYHIYNDEFKPKNGGALFMIVSTTFHEPASDSESDIIAAEEANQFEWGQYTHPIYSETGDFPPIMKEKIAAKSAAQGYPKSRLPELTPEEVQYIKGTSDIFGLNHYSSTLVYRNASVAGSFDVPSFDDDLEMLSYEPSEWHTAASAWITNTPWGFYKILTKIREDYNNPIIFITENGYTTDGSEVIDDARISYHRQYFDAMLDAIEEGSNVGGYTFWSLMDNFMWTTGFSEVFGLYKLDLESPERAVTPRKSAFVYKEIIRTRELDFHYEPDTWVMTIDEGH